MMENQNSSKYFVPIWDTVIRRYDSMHKLPPHDRMDRKLCHGEIRLTLTARTPLMVSDGNPIREGRASIARFVTDPWGRYRIPGSTLRGLIRQNMQILGLGLIRANQNGEISDAQVYGGGSPADGLPQAHLVPQDDNLLDYPRSILGFVYTYEIFKEDPQKSFTNQKWNNNKQKSFSNKNQGEKKARTVTECYRTRVSFGDLEPVGTPVAQDPVLLEQQLPKQSSEEFITWTEDGFQLSGIRQYPLRTGLQAQDQFASQGFRPLKAGSQFTGAIRYRNLHPDELGLLLWCLRLEEGCLHTMGMGKSAGYGQVELKIDALVEHDPNALYGSLTAVPQPTADARRFDELIQAYQQQAAELAGVESLPRLRHIQTFLALKTPGAELPKPIRPVRPAKPVQPAKPTGPSQKELRRQAKTAAPQATKDEVNDWRAKLNERFKSI